MRRCASLICMLVLAGCGGGAFRVTPPAAPTGTLFVADADGISVFPAAATGNATPQRRIAGLSETHYGPNGAGLGLGFSTKNVVAIAAGATSGTVAALVVREAHLQPSTYVVDEFGPTANGVAHPDNVYDGAPVGRGLAAAKAIAGVPGSLAYDVVAGFGFVAMAPPTVVFRTAVAQFGMDDRGIGLDADGNVYVSSRNPDKVAVYAAASTGDATPFRTIATASPPGALAIGPDGTLYVVEQAGSNGRFTIEEFEPGSPAPARVLGPFALDEAVVAITLDQQNELYVAEVQIADSALTSIAVFAPGASGGATPVRILQNPTQHVVSIAVGP